MTTAAIKTLYLGDNGRITCGDLRCAGMTAFASHMMRDLSGAPMLRLSPEMVRVMSAELSPCGLKVACERCRAEASLLVT